MEAAEVIQNIRAALSELKAEGTSAVSVAGLEEFINDLERRANSSLELLKLQSQFDLANYEARVQHSVEMFRSVIEAGREALKAVVLINGGAVVALLGFLGAAIAKSFPSSLGLSLAGALGYFGAGVLLGALGFGARYSAQASYSQSNNYVGIQFHVLSVVFAVVAYLFFGIGVIRAYGAFVGYISSTPS
jgi:hypothetical protein